MKQADRNIVLEWERFCALISLSKKVEKDLDDNSQNASNGSGNCSGTKDSVSLESFLESAILYYHPSFIGYFKAAAALLKQAFRDKERKDFILIHRQHRGFPEKKIVFDNT